MIIIKNLSRFLALVLALTTAIAQNNKVKDDLDFILKDDDTEKKGFFQSSNASIRFGIPLPLVSLPDSIKFSPFNSLGTGIYFRYSLELTKNFSIVFSPMLWFHKVGYKPSANRVFPSIDSNNTLEKLRTTSLGLSIEMEITVARDNKGRRSFLIVPGFEADFPLIQTLKKKYQLKTADGRSYDAKTKLSGIDIFYQYRYSAYLLIGHRTVGLRLAYWFTPWFKTGKYNIVNGVPIANENGTRSIPPVSQFEIGIYWGL